MNLIMIEQMIPGAQTAKIRLKGSPVLYTEGLKEWVCPKGEVYLVLDVKRTLFGKHLIDEINKALLEFQEYEP